LPYTRDCSLARERKNGATEVADFRVSLSKGPQGELLVFGNYLSGSEPVFVERVIVEELNAAGNTVMGSVFHLNRSIDPGQGSYLLVSKSPSGANVTAARASAYYLEIKQIARSDKLNL